MDEKDILKRLVQNDALFRKIHVITQTYDILPLVRERQKRQPHRKWGEKQSKNFEQIIIVINC